MEQIVNRVRNMVGICWESFSAKVGSGLIAVNKEASMQLQFAYILKNALDLTIYNDDETVELELETAIHVNGRLRECDIVIQITKGEIELYLPIEMKCYKEYASSGGKRGASDIFMKDVYQDLELLESYSKTTKYTNGISLVMTDFRGLVFPETKRGKKWDYDISEGTFVEAETIKGTPIGGYDVNIALTKSYCFNWVQINKYYFLKLESND
ncbi:hypothetical protein D7030_01385 [Flavobacteriaceae bacterium AU392]|nr:hypothetical protein D1817_07840 [Flavobacteriaceae bacterium]RKM86532.1 hypothetical protein D7030_01385 [Flavobacteriaceae bacterium AU392]